MNKIQSCIILCESCLKNSNSVDGFHHHEPAFDLLIALLRLDNGLGRHRRGQFLANDGFRHAAICLDRLLNREFAVGPLDRLVHIRALWNIPGRQTIKSRARFVLEKCHNSPLDPEKPFLTLLLQQ